MRRVTACVEQTALYDGCGASVLCSDVRSAGCQPVFYSYSCIRSTLLAVPLLDVGRLKRSVLNSCAVRFV